MEPMGTNCFNCVLTTAWHEPAFCAVESRNKKLIKYDGTHSDLRENYIEDYKHASEHVLKLFQLETLLKHADSACTDFGLTRNVLRFAISPTMIWQVIDTGHYGGQISRGKPFLEDSPMLIRPIEGPPGGDVRLV
jgi:hypothetical protein